MWFYEGDDLYEEPGKPGNIRELTRTSGNVWENLCQGTPFIVDFALVATPV